MEALISEGVSSPDDWVWVKQLRYYRTGRTGATALAVKMADATLDYSWEYQGNAPTLVYTPLTDRCYLTLTQVARLTCLLLPHTVPLLKLGMCYNLQVLNAKTAMQLFGCLLPGEVMHLLCRMNPGGTQTCKAPATTHSFAHLSIHKGCTNLQQSKEQKFFAPSPLSMPGVQGITLGYGGNPYGPAGTGKTESVKALGQALARQVSLLLLVCHASDVLA